MAQYIDKSAVIAKIRSLQDSTMDEEGNFYTAKAQAEYNYLYMLESFLDILEVKEVDLEKELQSFFYPHVPWDDYYKSEQEDIKEWSFKIAKHFYELGLKAQKGE